MHLNVPDLVWWRKWSGLLAVSAVVLVVGTRRAYSGVPLWRDEAASAIISQRSWPSLFRLVAFGEGGMGPYHLCLKVWTTFSATDGWIRMFSVAGAVALVVSIHWCVRTWAGVAAANAACVVALFSPFVFIYVAEARGYTWAMALLVTAFGLLATAGISTRRAVGAGVCVGLAAAINPVLLAFVVLLGGGLLVGAPNRRAAVALLPWFAGGAVLAFAPFTPVLVLRGGDQTASITEYPIRWMPEFLRQLLGGWYPTLALLAGLTLATAFAVRTLVRGGRRPWLPMAAVAGFGLPVTLAVASQIRPLWLTRYLVPGLPFAAMVAAVGLVARPHRFTVVRAALVAAAALMLWSTTDVSVSGKAEDLRGAARFIEDSAQPGDVIVYYPAFSRAGLSWYLDDALAPPDVAFVKWVGHEMYATEASTTEIAVALVEAERVWLVGYPWATWSPTPEPLAPLVPRLEERLIGEWWFGQFRVALAERRSD